MAKHGLAAVLWVTLLLSCGRSDRHERPDDERGGQPVDHIFTDQSDAIHQYVFVIRDGRVFAQQATFPGYATRSYYLSEQVPDELRKGIDAWADHPGEVKPPFAPDSIHYYATSLSRATTQPGEMRFFRNDNQAIRAFLLGLRQYVVSANHRIASPPEWVTNDPRITMFLGL